MAEALILDSEAVNALANAARRGVLANRSRAIVTVARERGALVRVPAPVLAEVFRGPRFDVPVEALLNGRGILVCDLTAEIAKRAGHVLARAKLGSEHAVGAFVVATAMSFSSATIATGDPDDIGRLVAGRRGLRVLGI